MDDASLLKQLAALFLVEKSGAVIWPWLAEVTVAEAGSPDLEAALRAYWGRERLANLTNYNAGACAR